MLRMCIRTDALHIIRPPVYDVTGRINGLPQGSWKKGEKKGSPRRYDSIYTFTTYDFMETVCNKDKNTILSFVKTL